MGRTVNRSTVVGLASVTLLAASLQSQAAGFAIIEQNASSLGNAFAGAAASPQDASTVFFNPAGMTYLSRPQVVMAAHIIDPQADFSNQGSTNAASGALTGSNADGGATAYVPNFYYTRPLANGWVAGLGVNAPFGLKTEYDRNWVGRYHGVESDLRTININPALAWKSHDNLSVGVGLNVQYIDATLSGAVDFGTACLSPSLPCGSTTGPGSADGFSEMSGDDWSWGLNAGLLYEPDEDTRIGLAYRSRVSHILKGDIRYTTPGNISAGDAAIFASVFPDSDVSASVNLPETVSVSVARDLNSRWEILGDFTWTRWNRFQELRVIRTSGARAGQTATVTDESWTNSIRVSLGANYRYSDRWLLRTGIAFDEEPIPDAAHRTPRIPGNDRRWLAVGARYQSSDTLTVDIGYAHLFVSDTPINHTDALGNTLTGNYDNAVDILSAQAVWAF